jgi:hypothetical protein
MLKSKLTSLLTLVWGRILYMKLLRGGLMNYVAETLGIELEANPWNGAAHLPFYLRTCLGSIIDIKWLLLYVTISNSFWLK